MTLLGLGFLTLWVSSGARSDRGASLEEAAPIIGMPPPGAILSDPTLGDLVLQWEGSGSGTMWIYADGRLISAGQIFGTPADAGEEYIGLAERRLAPEGVEFLRSSALGTGLFASDLTLAREGDVPYLMIAVSNRHRLVRVTYAGRLITGDAPVASAEQRSALLNLNWLLTDPRNWPPGAWEDPMLESYVPSAYSVCFGVPDSGAESGGWWGKNDPERAWAVLPEPVQELLRAGESTGANSRQQDGGCSRMATDDARTLARTLGETGIQPIDHTQTHEYWLGFEVVGPEYVVRIRFNPILPHGEAAWLGPG